VTDRNILIGDLHGCFDEAVQLLTECRATSSDRVIFLGDFIDRGPENAKCCDLVREVEQRQGSPAGILGNHEARHIEYETFTAQGRTLDESKMPPTHVATRKQLRPEHHQWFRSLPLYLRLPEHNVVAVHAGVYPGRPIEEQRPRHLLHIQTISPYVWSDSMNALVPRADERSVWPSKAPNDGQDWRFWTHFWDGPETVVFGHSVLTRPLVTDKVVGIDGGAVFGYDLHAYILPEKRIGSVKAAKDYGGGRRGNRPDSIQTFLIHGDVATYS
jgi:hypothetical protein